MTFRAEAVRPVHAEIGLRIQVNRDRRTRSRRRLTGFVIPLQDVPPLRPMRTVRTVASEFSIVVTVMAISAENLGSHGSTIGRPATEVQHGWQQAGLRQSTAAG